MQVVSSELSNRTLTEALLHWCDETPEKVLYRYVDGKGREVKTYTYEQFEEETRAVAHYLKNTAGLQPGDKALLVYPPGLDFIVAFIACIRARVTAVPVYPPRPGANKDLSMFLSVHKDCNPSVALTNSTYGWAKRIDAIRASFRTGTLAWPKLSWYVTSGVSTRGVPPRGSLELPLLEDIAFLQYTSGSTSAPKGVMVSNKNLRHNLASITVALPLSQETVVVSWLPQYHDMGLIGSHLGALYPGGTGCYMSPISFVKSPPLWMEMVSKYQATHLQAPNFAYQLVTRKWNAKKQKPSLSLGSVKHIFNAAEPIEGDAIDNFLKTFTPFGLSPSAMQPGYGLAESTVYVCDGGVQRLWVDKNALESDSKVVIVERPAKEEKGIASQLVGCGYPSRLTNAHIEVLIVDADKSLVQGEDVVGEIWISSESCSQGYYGKTEKNKVDMHAKLADTVFGAGAAEGDEKEVLFRGKPVEEEMKRLSELEFVRTGDLGFYHNRELFVCGRMKDLVIVRGRNHYPQDLEQSAERADGRLRPGCSAAFTVVSEEAEAEVLGIVCEVRDTAVSEGGAVLDEVIRNIRTALTQEHGVTPASIVLIKERTVEKTTSGKISRHRVRRAFMEGKLQVVKEWTAKSEGITHPAAKTTDATKIESASEKAKRLTEETPSEKANPSEMQSAAKSTVKSVEENEEIRNEVLPEKIKEAKTEAKIVEEGVKEALAAAMSADPSSYGEEKLLEFLREEVSRLVPSQEALWDPTKSLVSLGMNQETISKLHHVMEQKFGTIKITKEDMLKEGMTVEAVKDSLLGKSVAKSIVSASKPRAPSTTTSMDPSPSCCPFF